MPFWLEGPDGPEEFQCDQCKEWFPGRPEYWYKDRAES